jgi:4-carboxymuconolactone decarboxylase
VQDCAQASGTSAAHTRARESRCPDQKGKTLDRETYRRGLRIRSEVLGEEYVNRALANADDFTGPLQDLVTEYCWGAVWGREELPRKTRSMLNLAMISVLNRPNELRTHVKAALTNGVTREEIREVFLQVAIYAGVPAAVDSFRIANDAFAELDRDRGDR